MLSSSESRRRKKDPDRERTSPRSKDKDREEKRDRHKSSKSGRSSRKTSSSISKESDRERPRERSSKERIRTSSSTSQTLKANRMAVVPEMERRGSLGSPNGSRTSLSYPTLSRTHAKENIYAREDVERRKSPFTPEATDVGDDGDVRDGAENHGKHPDAPTAPTRAPPSPPLTATTGADLRKTASANSMRRKNVEAVQRDMEAGRRSVDSGTRLTPEPRFAGSRSSLREVEGEVEGTDLTSTTGSSAPSTVKHSDKTQKIAVPKSRGNLTPDQTSPAPKTSRQASEITESTDSEATSVAPGHGATHKQRTASPTGSDISPASLVDSSPRTPTQHSILPSVLSAQKDRPPTVEVFTEPASRPVSVDPGYGDTPLTPPPPPPPPALTDPPRVDYLLQHGGLSQPTVRNPLAAVEGAPIASYSQYASPRVAEPLALGAQALFQPLQKVLDDYNSVMDHNGSLAVATGYRSIARRLLDRLEAVFARNISSEFCNCIMCLADSSATTPHPDDAKGVNWGGILELVSGRCELPNWPPFDHAPANGLGISELETPCQRIDVDVPEEYRDHYARQSRKTKVAVQSWLSNQQDTAPEDADEETLTFAMLTRLEQGKRPLFYALLYGLDHIPGPRAQPRAGHGTPPSIAKAKIALQRLYRLAAAPRDQLVAIYLIRNPQMHDILATLAAVTKHEWEILVSGRFDGFLWSGAEGLPLSLGSPPPMAGPSNNQASQFILSPSGGVSVGSATAIDSATANGPGRIHTPMGTPFNFAASPRPGSTRPGSTRPGSTRPGFGPAPVQMDEDTEIAILAEVEREIYAAMDALENAFEVLHINAEVARNRLRNRAAALQMVAQARRGSAGVEVRTDTPASFGNPDLDRDSLEDLRSEIGPDDSASNVSHNRHRRAHRTRARRTPAPVEEEIEEEVGAIAERIRRRL